MSTDEKKVTRVVVLSSVAVALPACRCSPSCMELASFANFAACVLVEPTSHVREVGWLSLMSTGATESPSLYLIAKYVISRHLFQVVNRTTIRVNTHAALSEWTMWNQYIGPLKIKVRGVYCMAVALCFSWDNGGLVAGRANDFRAWKCSRLTQSLLVVEATC